MALHSILMVVLAFVALWIAATIGARMGADDAEGQTVINYQGQPVTVGHARWREVIGCSFWIVFIGFVALALLWLLG